MNFDNAISGEKPPGTRRSPLLIENVYEKDTTESFIERHFRESGVHRCRAHAEFDVDQIVADFGASLIRSAQEVEPDPEASGLKAGWTMLVFRRSPSLFWHFLVKNQNNYGSQPDVRLFTLTVSSDDFSVAAAEVITLQKRYTATEDQPGFFMVRDVKNPRRMPIKPEYVLSEELMNLHYGDGFAEWSARFAAGLNQNGLSILRGKPGTGKTSYLRHLIHSLSGTHRFYYLPADAFGLLQVQMAEFLSKEQRRFPDAHLVLVLEDAEQLLLSRGNLRDGLASSLLNFTDGFVGDLVRAHLVCTINSEIQDLDEAVLRPGRQRFFREFGLLNMGQATRLATVLGIALSESRSYSLAELYHHKDTQDAARLSIKNTKVIGFAGI